MAYNYWENNNPGNIGYFKLPGQTGGTGWDTGHQIATYPSLDAGFNAMSRLALGKYRRGAITLNSLIAGQGGWTPGNSVAAANIGRYMGVDPNQDLNLTDPGMMRRFQRALNMQETGSTKQFDAWAGGQPTVGEGTPGAVVKATANAPMFAGRGTNAPKPGTTLNSQPASGAPTAAAGGGSPSGATPAPPQQFAGVKAGSPAEKAMAAAQKSFAGGDGKDTPELPAPPPLPPAQPQGGLMMMGPGGMNQLPRALAQQYLQQQGVQTAPSLASFTAGALPPPVQPGMPGAATGMPSMPGTTLNSPSQLQMALMTGALNPYDLYAGGGGFGGYQGS